MVVGIIGLIYPVSIYGLTWLGWLMVLFGFFGHITAFQRFAHVWANVK
jgi:archaetidylinositol phosphate synthase